jgi:hypothetical protein
MRLVRQLLLELGLPVSPHDMVLPLEIQQKESLPLVKRLLEQTLADAHLLTPVVHQLIVVVLAGLFLRLNPVLRLEIQLGEFLRLVL